MSHSVNAFHVDEWDSLGLADYSDFSDKTTECNMEELGDGTRGEWFYIPEGVLPNGDMVIYWGTWNDDHSPGASCYTYAEVYDPSEKEDYLKGVKHWEDAPEWLDEDEEEVKEEWAVIHTETGEQMGEELFDCEDAAYDFLRDLVDKSGEELNIDDYSVEKCDDEKDL